MSITITNSKVSYGPSIVTDGLLLYLDAANPNSYPGSGNIWYDLSGNGNHGALVNGVLHDGSAMVFDGVNDYVALPALNSIGSIPSHSLELWVQSYGLGSGMSTGGLFCLDYGIISQVNGAGAIEYRVYSTEQASSVFSMSSTGVNIFGSKFYHIVMTLYENNYARIYVDGNLNSEIGVNFYWSGSNTWSSMPMRLGANPNNVYYYFNGLFVVSRLYNSALSSSEITQNFNAQKGRFGL